MSEREQFINTLKFEFPITMKLLKAYPQDKYDWKPHPKSKSAKELAWNFVGEELMIHQALEGGIDFQNMPKPPATFEEILAAYEKTHHETIKKFEKLSDADFSDKMIKFYAGPKQMVDMPVGRVCWFMIMDAVHHRGQFSVYIRLAGGKVPSIYGPSADEPW